MDKKLFNDLQYIKQIAKIDNILDKLDKRIRVYFKDEYHPVGGV